MFLRKINALFAILALTAAASVAQAPSIVRKAPPLTFTKPSGTETQLSSFDGKVVVVEFLFVASAHCMRLAQMLNKLEHELGPNGFQAVGVAFGPNADGVMVTRVMDYFKLTYPVGYTSAGEVDAYLGRTGKEILKIPQLVVIDRKGMIRAVSGSNGNPSLENEPSLRSLIDTLLTENGPAHDRERGKIVPAVGPHL
jgi:peroxiredoxin